MGAVAREVVEKYGDSIMEHPVGTGPFRLTEWRRSSHLVLERNPEYRTDIFHVTPDPADADAQRIARALDGRRLPLIDRVELSVIEESQPRWLSFLAGETDLLYIMPRDMAELALPDGKPAPNLAKKQIRIERQPQIDVTLLLYNMDNGVVGGYTPEKVALRRAISLGLDTAELIRTYYKFQAFPAQSPLMPAQYGYDPALRTENGITSVARARALLDQYGYLPRHRTAGGTTRTARHCRSRSPPNPTSAAAPRMRSSRSPSMRSTSAVSSRSPSGPTSSRPRAPVTTRSGRWARAPPGPTRPTLSSSPTGRPPAPTTSRASGCPHTMRCT